MLIVDYETFIRMPAGTIFAPYKPCVFKERFEIKVDGGCKYKNKWVFNGTMPLEPCFDESTRAFDYGQYDTNFEIYDGDSNDASAYKMFAVLEPHEIMNLVNVLLWAMNGCEGYPLTHTRSEPTNFIKSIEHEFNKRNKEKENA